MNATPRQIVATIVAGAAIAIVTVWLINVVASDFAAAMVEVGK